MKILFSILFAVTLMVNCSAPSPKKEVAKKNASWKVYHATGGESLRLLAAKWRIPLEEILLENPGIVSKVLKKGDVVYLPYSSQREFWENKRRQRWGHAMRYSFNAFGFHLPCEGTLEPVSLPSSGRSPLAFEIRNPSQREVRCVEQGRVVVLQEKSDGKGSHFLIIAHPGSLFSCYGSLAEVSTHAGALVRKGEVLGRIGTLEFPRAHGIRFCIFSAWWPPFVFSDGGLMSAFKYSPAGMK